MDSPLARVALNLGCALVAGAVIGAERSFNGRSAGFRTHALVSLAAAGAMTISLEPQFIAGASAAAYLDPTRLGQGVMTGVGFLGAGVIFKEGISIQGLTTAAAVWTTAAVGMLMGLGMYGPGALLTAAALVVLVALRTVEAVLPRNVYAYATFAFEPAQAPDERQLSELLGECSVRLYDVSFGRHGERLEYRASLVTMRESGLRRLAERLKETPGLVEFDLAKLNK
jgi:putative Mg2+ transporter-C (MgtC) family protein